MIKVILESLSGNQKEVMLPVESVVEAGIIECEFRYYVYAQAANKDQPIRFVEAKVITVTNT